MKSSLAPLSRPLGLSLALGLSLSTACAKDPTEGAGTAAWEGPYSGSQNELLSNEQAVCSAPSASLKVLSPFTVTSRNSRAGMFQDFSSLARNVMQSSRDTLIRVEHSGKTYSLLLSDIRAEASGVRLSTFRSGDLATASDQEVQQAFYVSVVAKKGSDIPPTERHYANLEGVFIDRINVQAKQGGARAELVCTRPFLSAARTVDSSAAAQSEYNQECAPGKAGFRAASADFVFTVNDQAYKGIVQRNASARVKWSLYAFITNSRVLVSSGEARFDGQDSVSFSIPVESVGAKSVTLEVYGASGTPFTTKSQTFTVTKREGSCALGFGEDALRNQQFRHEYGSAQ